MTDFAWYASTSALVIWIINLLLPWQAWRVREVLEAAQDSFDGVDLSDITVLIPARNEAELIGKTLAGLEHQGQGLRIILVDDDSSDGTSDIVRQSAVPNLQLIQSAPLPPGWSGKLWAQEQGLRAVETPLTLLLDADIELVPDIINSLKVKRLSDNLQLVSLMAVLRFETYWEKLLMPAFIHFFKMIYPFALANKPGTKIAAAAGGCILVETAVLREIGGMAAIQNALIDDCALAKAVKTAGYKTWIGLTHGVISQRPYSNLAEIWDMVARTAFTQLFYSTPLLLLCSAIMLLMYCVPVIGVLGFEGGQFWLCVGAFMLMVGSYLPTLRFYTLSWLWALSMPLVAILYQLMTWTSAIRYWRGERSRWKGRSYQKI